MADGLEIEYPDVESVTAAVDAAPPRTLRHVGASEPWPLTLVEAVQIALANNEVMKGLGVNILEHPEQAQTLLDPAIQETDPQYGTEAALSAFDAQFGAEMFFGGNRRPLNNLASRGVRDWRQNTGGLNAEITKRAATGADFALRHVTTHDANVAPLNLFPSSWDSYVEAGFRQPLLQGAGVPFNRIAGPGGRPGEYNGVLIARLRTDVQLADFEIAVRNLLRDTQQAYWRLYFAYRDVDAKRDSYNEALRTWQLVQDRLKRGDVDGEKEALARERVYIARADLESALSGPTRRYAEESVGYTSASADDGGLYGFERRLRLLMGLPSSDGRLIRPADPPIQADIVFDWHDSIHQSQIRRPELRKQKWRIKRRELELTAAHNFGLMRMDVFGNYRVGGFGDDLFGNSSQSFGSSYGDFGNLQEWRVGVEMKAPVGNRQGHAAIRNAELQLARSRALLKRQELEARHELSAAFAQLDRSYKLSRTRNNRRLAAHQRLDALRTKFENRDEANKDSVLEFLLDAQRRAAIADRDYHRSIVDYNLAIGNLHLARGSFLEYVNVHLSEAPWSAEAYQAAQCQAEEYVLRTRPRPSLLRKPGSLGAPTPISRGPLPQEFLPSANAASLSGEIVPLSEDKQQTETAPSDYYSVPAERTSRREF